MTSQAAGGGLGCQGGVIHGLKHDDRQPSNRLNKSLRVLLKGGSQCRTAGGINCLWCMESEIGRFIDHATWWMKINLPR